MKRTRGVGKVVMETVLISICLLGGKCVLEEQASTYIKAKNIYAT